MRQSMHNDAHEIINEIIAENMPDTAVKKALQGRTFDGAIHVLAIGKAAWVMAKACHEVLVGQIKRGIVITKYDHSKGDIPGMEIIEAGHPLSDENTLLGTAKAIEMADSLTESDFLIVLISGGGSALFEKPQENISLDDIIDVSEQLIASGADIVEINSIRKRLSAVKAGRFAQLCRPAKLLAVVLSDVLGDRLDTIASGPVTADSTTVDDALNVVAKYRLSFPESVLDALRIETPKNVDNVESIIIGNVRSLCTAAANAAQARGYSPLILTTTIDREASEVGRLIASVAREIAGVGSDGGGVANAKNVEFASLFRVAWNFKLSENTDDFGIVKFAENVMTVKISEASSSTVTSNFVNESNTFQKLCTLKRPCAIILGGETVVHLKGSGLGGRNQELALTAALHMDGLRDVLLFSLGSDGTDGPTDAAGGIVDGSTASRLAAAGFDIKAVLANNDSYNGLKAVGGLIMTGPTGTNINDVTVLLCR